MTENYLNILAETIRNNWDQLALTDFYLTEDGTAQDTSRGNHYTYGEMYSELCRVADLLTALGLKKGDYIAICGANSARDGHIVAIVVPSSASSATRETNPHAHAPIR